MHTTYSYVVLFIKNIFNYLKLEAKSNAKCQINIVPKAMGMNYSIITITYIFDWVWKIIIDYIAITLDIKTDL